MISSQPSLGYCWGNIFTHSKLIIILINNHILLEWDQEGHWKLRKFKKWIDFLTKNAGISEREPGHVICI